MYLNGYDNINDRRNWKMDERIKIYDTKMTKSYNNLLDEFGAIRAGRANPHVLDRITVEYYGRRLRCSR